MYEPDVLLMYFWTVIYYEAKLGYVLNKPWTKVAFEF